MSPLAHFPTCSPRGNFHRASNRARSTFKSASGQTLELRNQCTTAGGYGLVLGPKLSGTDHRLGRNLRVPPYSEI